MRKLILLTLALFVSSAGNAAVLKIATVTPEGSAWMEAMRAGAKEIKERTDGRVEIKYYGGGVMGNDDKVLGKIRIGNLHGGAFTPSALQSIYPDVSLYGLPLVFDSEEEAAYVRDRLDQTLRDGMSDKGFVTFGFAATGFAVLMSNEPVKGLADLKGKRVWVPEGDTISYASMEALSLSPVTLPMTDVLTGLQTGLIDIVAVSPIGALVLQWHTKVSYVTDLPLVYTMGFMAVSKRSFGKLAPGDQQIVREVMDNLYAEFNEKNLVDNKDALQALLNAGIELVAPADGEKARIRDVLAKSNRSMAVKGDFSLDLYERMMQYVEEYRSGQGTVAGN
ncbi:MAG: TRAP transporter substrate-binding protein DctP [Woeseiaceae bacterium]|nr:TRAP transporter substrate-binding protein DctP [Woeseiaceae bacterium]